MKKLNVVLLILSLTLLLVACGKSAGDVVKVKGYNGEELKVHLMDVWQDTDQKVMVSLKGQGPGKLLDIAAQPTGRSAMPYVKVRILIGEEWLDKEEYPQGMFSNDDNGSFTVRFAATELPSQVDIDGEIIQLDKVQLEGVDHQALLDAEAEVYCAREEAERQKEEAAQQRLNDAQIVPPKSEADLTWTNDISLASGESLYYGVTGLENADSVVVSFVLSADGVTAHTVRADLVNGRNNNTVFNTKTSIMMSYPVKDGRLTVESDGLLLDVVIDGDRAEGVFDLGVDSGSKDVFGRSKYNALGIARIEMERR